MNAFHQIQSESELRDLARIAPNEGLPYVDAWTREAGKGTPIAPAFPQPFQLKPSDLAPNPFHHASDK